jgi:tRNA 2-thiouridine synthesizing protein E
MEPRTPDDFPRVDADGHLRNPGEWNAAVARELARQRGITLTPAHWAVLDTLRDYYFRFGSAPTVDSICRFFGDRKERVRALFGNCLDAWLIAGLPNPGDQERARIRLM